MATSSLVLSKKLDRLPTWLGCMTGRQESYLSLVSSRQLFPIHTTFMSRATRMISLISGVLESLSSPVKYRQELSGKYRAVLRHTYLPALGT